MGPNERARKSGRKQITLMEMKMTDNKQEYVPASDRPDVKLNPEQRGRMNRARLLLLVCLASLSACTSGAPPNESDAVSSLTAPGGDQCALGGHGIFNEQIEVAGRGGRLESDSGRQPPDPS